MITFWKKAQSKCVWSLLWKAGRSCATGDAARGTHGCVLTPAVAAACAGSWQGRRAGAFSPTAHTASAFLLHFFGFLYSASPTCNKNFQIPYFILLLLSMQSPRTQFWACKMKTVLPIANICKQFCMPNLFSSVCPLRNWNYQASHSGWDFACLVNAE